MSQRVKLRETVEVLILIGFLSSNPVGREWGGWGRWGCWGRWAGGRGERWKRLWGGQQVWRVQHLFRADHGHPRKLSMTACDEDNSLTVQWGTSQKAWTRPESVTFFCPDVLLDKCKAEWKKKACGLWYHLWDLVILAARWEPGQVKEEKREKRKEKVPKAVTYQVTKPQKSNHFLHLLSRL